MDYIKFNELKQLLNLRDSELHSLIIKNPKLETLPIEYIKQKVDYLSSLGATSSDITQIALNSTNILFAPPHLVSDAIDYFTNRFNLSRKEMILAIINNMNAGFYFMNKQDIEEQVKHIQAATQLSDTQLKSIFIQTYCLSNENKQDILMENLKIAYNYGIDINKVNDSLSFLGYKPSNLEIKLRIGMLAGNNPTSFIKNKKYYSNQEFTYALYMAQLKGEIADDINIFSNRKYLYENLGDSLNELLKKHPLDDNAKNYINRTFESRFPSVIAAINGEKYEIKTESSVPSLDGIEKFIMLFQNNFKLSRGEIYNIINHYKKYNILKTTQEDINRNIAKLVGKYDLRIDYIQKLVINNPLAITDTNGKLDSLYNFLSSKYNITPKEYRNILCQNGYLLQYSQEELEKYHTELKNEANLTSNECKKLLLTTTSFGKQPAKEVKAKLLLLEVAGIDWKNGDIPFTILASSFDNIETKLKIALLTNTNLNELVSYAYNMPIKKLWARYKGIVEKDRFDLNPFSMSENLNIDGLYTKYPYDEAALSELDDTFDKKQPIKSKKMADIRNYYIYSDPLNLDFIYSREEEPKDGIVSIAESVAANTRKSTHTEETHCDITKQSNTISNYNFKRFKRLTGATDEQIYQIIQDNPSVLTNNVWLNNAAIYHCYGVDFAKFATKTKVLALNPDKTQIRLMLAKLCGITDGMFLSKYYAYDESKVYTKMCVLRALKLPTRLAYAKDEEFEKRTDFKLDNCHEMFKYDNATKKYIEENFDDMMARIANEAQGEANGENE